MVAENTGVGGGAGVSVGEGVPLMNLPCPTDARADIEMNNPISMNAAAGIKHRNNQRFILYSSYTQKYYDASRNGGKMESRKTRRENLQIQTLYIPTFHAASQGKRGIIPYVTTGGVICYKRLKL